MQLTYFDSNSWLIELGGKRILLDPWLVGKLIFGNLGWLFRGSKTTERPIPENIDLILLSQGLEDHAHTPTLKQLDHNIPVVASPNAAKVVQELGYTQVTTLGHHESYIFDNTIEIKAVPGSPVGPTLVENGYILKALDSGLSLYYEPHGYHGATLKEMSPIDVIITPIIDLKLPLLGSVIKGQKNALEVCQWLRPQVILPTAAGGDINFEGLLISFLSTEGTSDTFRHLLQENKLSTQVLEPKSGEKVVLDLKPLVCG
ncbi:Zn-dependent hydrolase [Aphanothece hegewaldii CCALA 016]|uniref:Zn-dependent hydrolase n=1 Tax=Aphanothece hegewaldii CCALA 016 TaxID=2107694 RepID=A0A2T1LUY2_9CHRO|nr:MBL fold metallo-hydrolase [Aphanothece hegewaldii]PSF35433.1 Zn-dependent hydrolase [Aphanothece hegewaldii CCALA 016]